MSTVGKNILLGSLRGAAYGFGFALAGWAVSGVAAIFFGETLLAKVIGGVSVGVIASYLENRNLEQSLREYNGLGLLVRLAASMTGPTGSSVLNTTFKFVNEGYSALGQQSNEQREKNKDRYEKLIEELENG